MELPRIQEVKDLKGKRVLMRVDFNVPVKTHEVVDDYRIRRSLITIEYLKKKGAKIVLMSHIGSDEKESLRPIANYFNKKKNYKVGFVPNFDAVDVAKMTQNMQEGSIMLLQNLRRDPGEVKNNETFAKKLATFGDIYVNDAFAVSHRKHASVDAITKYLPSYAGFLFQEEIQHLEIALNPKHPFLFILGGSKISTKMPLLEKFIKVADGVFVGGALANDLFESKGIEIGKSLADDKINDLSGLTNSKKLILPEDVLVAGGKNGASRKLEDITKDDVIVDIGPKTRAGLIDMVKKYKFVVFNGPMGNYEKGYDKGTKKLIKVLSDSTAKVIVGGGDTIALVSKMKLEKKFFFVSTGGGAMLDYLIDGELPGIDALIKTPKM